MASSKNEVKQILFAIAFGLVVYSASASPGRSSAAVAAFKRISPCPETGATRGACPGWQIDHVTPLKCGGPDHPSNMQWLTIEQHKAKTKAEAKLCRRRS